MKLGVSVGPPGGTYVCVKVPDDSETEGRLVTAIGDRLMKGYVQYGPFDQYKERSKDWLLETLEELLDASVYLAKKIEEVRMAMSAQQLAEEPPPTIPDMGVAWQGHCRGSGICDGCGDCQEYER